MTYRDENDALRARTERLERELEEAQGTIAKLRGESPASVGGAVEQSALLRGPARYEREVEIDHEIDDTGYERIAELLRARLGIRVVQVGRSLSCPGRFSLTRAGGRTKIRLSADWRRLGIEVLATSVLVGTFTALGSVGLLMDVITHGIGWAHSVPADVGLIGVAIAIPAALSLGAGALTRQRLARTARTELAASDETFAALLELAEAHAVRAPAVKARVADDAAGTAENDTSESEAARAATREPSAS